MSNKKLEKLTQLLSTMRTSAPFASISTNTEPYYDGRNIAYAPNGGKPYIRGSNELLGYIEGVLEQVTDEAV